MRVGDLFCVWMVVRLADPLGQERKAECKENGSIPTGVPGARGGGRWEVTPSASRVPESENGWKRIRCLPRDFVCVKVSMDPTELSPELKSRASFRWCHSVTDLQIGVRIQRQAQLTARFYQCRSPTVTTPIVLSVLETGVWHERIAGVKWQCE
jgi:hypothetical protein